MGPATSKIEPKQTILGPARMVGKLFFQNLLTPATSYEIFNALVVEGRRPAIKRHDARCLERVPFGHFLFFNDAIAVAVEYKSGCVYFEERGLVDPRQWANDLVVVSCEA